MSIKHQTQIVKNPWALGQEFLTPCYVLCQSISLSLTIQSGYDVLEIFYLNCENHQTLFRGSNLWDVPIRHLNQRKCTQFNDIFICIYIVMGEKMNCIVIQAKYPLLNMYIYCPVTEIKGFFLILFFCWQGVLINMFIQFIFT